MKKEWMTAVYEMRDAGYAVIVWTPEELKDAEPGWVEEMSISYGWEYLIPDQTTGEQP